MVSASYTADANEEEPENEKSPSETWDLNNEGIYVECEDSEMTDDEGELIEVCDYVFPWGGDEILQFKEYHTYETMKTRMMVLAQENPDIFQFLEGLNGGMNARGQETSKDTYEGWFYGHSSPWLKITGEVDGGEYNDFNGDTGNYPDRPDVMIVGNHHAREWMSYQTPILLMETIAFYYGKEPTDNDGDGLTDEDPWGDADGDGQVDDDGDCLALDPIYQDSNGDGKPCNPGDIGVDEDFSEVELTNMINNREIYLIPMLNTDGNIYDREVYMPGQCPGEEAWDCSAAGWRKNLRDNTVTGVTPIPDLDESVDEGCDGVDLNRNYQFEWGAPLGATGPLVPGACYAGQNNDVYNGPVDNTDNDGDCVGAPTPECVNEDHVDGKDDDGDGLVDEDWWGGNSEPETKFIQDMTEMNDDNGDGASEFKATLTYHSYSELVLYPWGHCTNCQSPDHDQLVYHGDQMATMTDYTNMQSSDLYPTSGDFCDWHYGVHGSYCYTMEIGTAFHQRPEDVDHIAVRNNGVAFYMIKIADNPRERADLEMSNIVRNQIIIEPVIPESGDIPVEMCLDNAFAIDLDVMKSHVMYRMVKPSRQQSDYGPKEWFTEPWSMTGFSVLKGETCDLLNDSGQGYKVVANLPVGDDENGVLHVKAMISTLGGTQKIEYPSNSQYYEMKIEYRAPFGNVLGSMMLFMTVAFFVWGGLGVCLRLMMVDEEEVLAELVSATELIEAEVLEEGSS